MTPEEMLTKDHLDGLPVHLVGIKGTGMTALAEILKARGARVSGSDVPETFFTDEILSQAGIPVSQGFGAGNIPADCRLGIRSAAWNTGNPEVSELDRRGIPMIQYTEALGILSRHSYSCAISGVHGKTSTTAMIGTLLKGADFAFTAIVGSGVSSFNGRSTWINGNRYLVAETCEYRRHFLSFHPSVILLTSIEEDHMDYFKDYNDIESAFLEFGRRLPPDGVFIYCADDKGAVVAAQKIMKECPSLRFVPYGENIDTSSGSTGRFRIKSLKLLPGEAQFLLSGFEQAFTLKVPGQHMILNAAGAIAAAITLWEHEQGPIDPNTLQSMARELSRFQGTKRRSELIGSTQDGILVMDDYGHHPTAIAKTLEGIRSFYPGRRIVCDFMSHTYSRTRALLPQFATCFINADIVILNKIYPSAREQGESEELDRELLHFIKQNHPDVHYVRQPEDVARYVDTILLPSDIFITMGAGNNWIAGRDLLALRSSQSLG